MVYDESFSDKKKVDIALQEYEIGKVNQEIKLKNGDYIGTVSHIYDNINGNEEQVFVLTNSENGPAAVPYSASDADRAQVQDVTVMMQGSQVDVSTPKLQHDTVTDWLPTDLVTASHRLGPEGAVEYTKPFVYRHTKNMITQKSREVLDQADRDAADFLGNAAGLLNKDVGQAVKQSFQAIADNPLNKLRKDIFSSVLGALVGHLAAESSIAPIYVGATVLKTTQKFPPAQFEDAARHLKETIRKYPNAKIDLYAHSLGSMDTQYALSCLTEEEMRHIGSVHIYNGPNIYPLLTKEQQARLDSAKYKIFNQIDHKDLVSLGYALSGSENAAGIVRHIKTTDQEIGDQHMMKGYIYDKNQNLVLMDGTGTTTLNDTLKARMIPYRNVKKYLNKTGGGLDGHEKIYLDSLQARLISDNLLQALKQGYETMQQARDQAMEEAEELAKRLRSVPWGFSLSPDEVAIAYQEGGADQYSVVTSLQEHFDSRLSRSVPCKRPLQI